MTIRVGLIGYGFIGKLMHAPYISAVPDMELVVIGSSRKDEVLSDYPKVEVLDDYVAVCEHPNVDLVVIASPNLRHFDLCKTALNAGHHVVCDKPWVENETQARELKKLAESKKLLLSVFQNRRFDAEFLAVKKAIKDGILGDVRLYESRLDRLRLDIKDRWREKPIPMSGLWWDIAPHLVDQAMELFGMPKRVTLSLARQRGLDQADDFAHAVLDYGELQVVCNMSMCCRPELAPRITVHGTKASIQKHKFDEQELQLKEGMTVHDPKFGIASDKLLVVNNEGKETYVDCPKGDHVRYYREVADAIVGKGKNPVPPIQAVALVHILHGAEKSAREGKVFECSLTSAEMSEYTASH